MKDAIKLNLIIMKLFALDYFMKNNITESFNGRCFLIVLDPLTGNEQFQEQFQKFLIVKSHDYKPKPK